MEYHRLDFTLPQELLYADLRRIFASHGKILKLFSHKTTLEGYVLYSLARERDKAFAAIHNSPPHHIKCSLEPNSKLPSRLQSLQSALTNNVIAPSYQRPSSRQPEVEDNAQPEKSTEMPDIFCDLDGKPVDVFFGSNGMAFVSLDAALKGVQKISCQTKPLNQPAYHKAQEKSPGSYSKQVNNGFQSDSESSLNGKPSGKTQKNNYGDGDKLPEKRQTNKRVFDYDHQQLQQPNHHHHQQQSNNNHLQQQQKQSNNQQQQQPNYHQRQHQHQHDNQQRYQQPQHQHDNQQRYQQQQSQSGGYGASKTSPTKPTRQSNMKPQYGKDSSSAPAAQNGRLGQAPKQPQNHSVVLPMNTFTEVIIMALDSPTEGWVQLVTHQNEVINLVALLQAEADKADILREPNVGKICLAKYEDNWYRARVISTSPKLKVRYIDFGNEYCVDVVKHISANLMKPLDQAVRIRLLPGAPQDLVLDSTLNVKAISFVNSTYSVEVENGIYSRNPVVKETMPKLPPPQSLQPLMTKPVDPPFSSPSLPVERKYYAELFEDGYSNDLLVEGKIDDSAFVVKVFPTKDFDNFKLNIKRVANQPNYVAKIDEMVAVINREKEWSRGIVLDSLDGQYAVAMIDCGYILDGVCDIRSLPAEYHSLPEAAFVVHDETPNSDTFRKGCWLTFTAIWTGTKIMLDIGSNKLYETSQWKPREFYQRKNISSLPPQNVRSIQSPTRESDVQEELVNNALVHVVHSEMEYLFVRTKDAHMKLLALNERIARIAGTPSAGLLKQPPVSQQVVLAKLGEHWRRAMVITAGTYATFVKFIDYGSEDEVDYRDLKMCPDELADEPPCLIKVKLRCINANNFSVKQRNFIKSLGNTKLAVVDLDNKANECEFTLPDGTALSAKLKEIECATPIHGNSTQSSSPTSTSSKNTASSSSVTAAFSPSKVEKAPEASKNKVIFVEEMKTEKFPVGPVNLQVLCNQTFSDSGVLLFCCFDNPESKKQVLEDVPKLIKEHVETLQLSSYKPMIEEMVVVKDNGMWHRATCVEHNDNRATVFLVDSGQNVIVETANIRPFSPKLLSIPAAANICNLIGLPEKISTALQNRLVQLLNEGDSYVMLVTGCDENGIYNIKMPDLTSQLCSEGLIQ